MARSFFWKKEIPKEHKTWEKSAGTQETGAVRVYDHVTKLIIFGGESGQICN